MNTIIPNINLMSNCNNVAEVEAKIRNYINSYLGNVIKDITEAEDVLGGEAHYGDTQTAEFDLDNGTARVSIKIEEVFRNGGSDDYCYIVNVEEVLTYNSWED